MMLAEKLGELRGIVAEPRYGLPPASLAQNRNFLKAITSCRSIPNTSATRLNS